MSDGIPEQTKKRVHVVNFNDLESIEAIMKKYPIACVLTEPVLQNIGVVKPRPGYLQGILQLCEQYGAVCIFDEVKTGFRTGLGGYQAYSGVNPHLSVFGKAVANGFPLGVVGGKREILQLFDAADTTKRVLIAGTYNGHPINAAAAIATITYLKEHDVYGELQRKSQQLYSGLRGIFSEKGKPFVLSSNASAFCTYFCENEPMDLHDVLLNHDSSFDVRYRLELIKNGIYHIPIPCKQGSVSYAHSVEDIDKTLEVTRGIVRRL